MKCNLSSTAWIETSRLNFKVDEQLLWDMCPIEHSKFYFGNQIIDNPRFDLSFGRDYTFSRSNHIALPVPDTLQPLLDYINGLGYGEFNQMLINYYRNGHDYIGSHPDNVKQLVPLSPILSLSLGATRKFRIRDMNKKIIKDIDLNHGDILVMCGNMQKEFKHEIVKVQGEKGKKIRRRINITFRQFAEEKG